MIGLRAVAAIGLVAWIAFPVSASSSASKEDLLLKQLQQLNQVPQESLSERVDPGFSILKTIYDEDGPDFLVLRKLIGQASVRSTLNPSVKTVIASILAQRWDTFPLCGNLWLAGLQSPNSDLRARARKRLVGFIQPAHIPVLIDLLRTPGPNILAYEVLQEVTGKNLDPTVQTWRAWWSRAHGKVDLIGHLLKDTRDQLVERPIRPFDQDRFWHLPAAIRNVRADPERRSGAEQEAVIQFNAWANTDVKRYVELWAEVKPTLDRVAHHPDARVDAFLEKLVGDPGIGDYASVVLAWRGHATSLPILQQAYEEQPTVGRALARGSLGDKSVLRQLLVSMEKNPVPSSAIILDDTVRGYVQPLHAVGVISAEQAFEILCHQVFDLNAAVTVSEKKKALRKARSWLQKNESSLQFDRRRGYFVTP